MKLLLKQKLKELYSSEFEILEKNNVVGNIVLQGNLGSMEVVVKGNFYGKIFSLEFSNKILKGPNKKFRPYNIIENNNIVGEVF